MRSSHNGPYEFVRDQAILARDFEYHAVPPQTKRRIVTYGRERPVTPMLPLYTLLIYLAAPVALAANLWRSRRDPAYGERLRERWGYTNAQFDRPPVWVHAVSVGEVQASAVLVRALRNAYPDRPVLMTTGTPTGAQRVRTLFGDTVRHVYLPYDMPGAVRRFLSQVRPAVGIIMETEIWPNLFRECRKLDIPLLLASARLSEKSVRRYARLTRLTRDALEHVRVAAQTELDAQRFRAIGASQVDVVGNLKFDIDVPLDTAVAGRALRETHLVGRAIWVAASTHEGEEERVLRAHEIVRSSVPNALLLLVPRHPQRFAGVASLLSGGGVRFVSRSAGEAVAENTEVLLVDTLGELLMFYAAADVAFVGGSLVPIGGHTLLEPAALGCPIVTGPHNFNSPDIAQLFLANGAAIQIMDADSLGNAIVHLLANADERQHMATQARAILENNRGALARLLEVIDSLLRSRA
jgi:3-deoxy-D-manno-octulosonic-acid transferase